MSNSYFSDLLQSRADQPPDISKTNYENEVVDMSKPVNENIDKTTELNEAHFASLVRLYEHQHNRAKGGPDRLVKLLETGTETYDEVEKFVEYRKQVGKYNAKYLPIIERLKANPDLIRQSGLTRAEYIAREVGDESQIKEVDAENNQQVVRRDANEVTQALAPVDPDSAQEIQQPYMDEQWRAESLVGLKDRYAPYRTYTEASMKILVGYTDDGDPIYKSYDNARNYEERKYISEIIDAWYFMQHQDVARGRLGLYKKDFINWALEQSLTRDKAFLEDSAAASAEVHKEQSAKELVNKIQLTGGQAFVTMVQTETPRFIDPYTGLASTALAKKFYKEQIISAIDTGILRREHVTGENGILEAWIQPYGTTDPSKKRQVKDYWKPESKEILKALNKQAKAEMDEHKDELQGQKDSAALAIINWANEEPRPYSELKKRINEFRSDFGLKTTDELPDGLKNLDYRGSKSDDELDKVLKGRLELSGTGPTQDEIYQFTSTDLRKKWQAILDAGGTLRKGSEGAGSIGWRDGAIRALLKEKTNEDIGEEDTGSPIWQANWENAVPAYNAEYAKNMAKPGMTPEVAHQLAIDHIQAKLYEVHPKGTKIRGKDVEGQRIWDSRQGITGPWVSSALQRAKAGQAINRDNDLIHQETPFDGEEKHLKAAAKYIQRRGNIPKYYSLLARSTSMNADELIIARLKANGYEFKDGQLVLPEDENLNKTDARKLKIKPTAGNTYKVTKDNPDYTWMLNTVQNNESLENGGYFALKDQDGKWTNVETVTGKTIDQITYGDVYALALGGYSHFGMYGLTAQGVVDIVESGQVPFDASWDKKDQDLLLLARLRQKAQQAQQNTGINTRYRRLVNIRKEDKERFKTIAGDLPPWLQLDTLLPECAKELCNAQLQQ